MLRRPSPRSALRALALGLIVAAAVAGTLRAAQRPPVASFAAPPDTTSTSAQPHFVTRFVSSTQGVQTHSASLVELRDGRVRAFWFEGSREGAGDVVIRTAVFDPVTSRWGNAQVAVTRKQTQHGLLRSVRKLGNPVPARQADGTLWLFYVTVSVGGWAGSSITAVRSTDEGANWSAPRRLITSPFLNVSTLVRGAPVLLADHTLVLPVYHEFLGKFGELLRIGVDGTVIDKQRLSDGRDGLQPILLVQSPADALALMRWGGEAQPPRVIVTRTRDGGRTWSTPAKTALANPNSAVTGVVLPDGRMVVALNDVGGDRDQLSLIVSSNGGRDWRVAAVLEDQLWFRDTPRGSARYVERSRRLAADTDPERAGDGSAHAESARRQMCVLRSPCAFEFSYPFLLETSTGDIHVVYTWNRSFVKDVQFNSAWLDERLKGADVAVHP